MLTHVDIKPPLAYKSTSWQAPTHPPCTLSLYNGRGGIRASCHMAFGINMIPPTHDKLEVSDIPLCLTPYTDICSSDKHIHGLSPPLPCGFHFLESFIIPCIHLIPEVDHLSTCDLGNFQPPPRHKLTLELGTSPLPSLASPVHQSILGPSCFALYS